MLCRARRETVAVNVGGVTIGGNAPVTVQSMTNTKTSNPSATLKQIQLVAEAGCEIVRVAIPDKAAAEALKIIVENSPIPVVADIHFDVQLAFRALEQGAAKIRINPGNLGGSEKLVKLAAKANEHKAALRIGVNAGSLERRLIDKYGGPFPEALAESAAFFYDILQKMAFHDVVVSIKASDVWTTICANRLFALKTKAPLHLGITEAGPPENGIIKSAVGIGALLAEGIGDTIRVSLTAAPQEEVKAARGILQALGLRVFGPELISCPTCGRCEVDLVPLAEQVEKLLKGYKIPIRVAVMGCIVNGPGEAREADLGISAGKKRGVLFRGGRVIRTVSQDQLLKALEEELRLFAADHNKGRSVD